MHPDRARVLLKVSRELRSVALAVVTHVRALTGVIKRVADADSKVLIGDFIAAAAGEVVGLLTLALKEQARDRGRSPVDLSLMLPSPEWLALVALQGSRHGCERT